MAEKITKKKLKKRMNTATKTRIKNKNENHNKLLRLPSLLSTCLDLNAPFYVSL